MTKPQEWATTRLDELETAWEAGDYPSMIEAVAVCRSVDWPLPEWLSQAVQSELTAYFNRGDRPGAGGAGGRKGRGGNAKAKAETARMHAMRHSYAKMMLAAGHGSRQAAFEAALELLRKAPGTPGAASWQAVRASYNKVEDAIARGEGEIYSEALLR